MVIIVQNSDPSYLKLHVEDSSDTASNASLVTGLDSYCRTFEEVTGWPLSIDGKGTRYPLDFSSRLRRRAAEDPGLAVQPGNQIRRGARSGADASPRLEFDQAIRLADALTDVLRELSETRQALLEREADLAAGVPVSARRDEETHLALRLEAILQGGAEAIGCQAAAVYMLDDATTELKMRSNWGLPNHRLLKPARPLRGSVADLEALIGHSVVIQDADRFPHWKLPESYSAAICVPISSPTEPLGTLWMFADRPTDFTGEQTNLTEIIAGRISSELQREVLLTECVSSKEIDRQLVRAAQWQREHQPNIVPLLDDWELVGWTSESPMLNSGFFDWFVPHDGSLAVALGHADGPMIQAALTAATLQSAIRSHAHYVGDASDLIYQVNETLWNGSAGGNFASAFYAQIAPATGIMQFSAAGEVGALLVGKQGVTSLTTPSRPLASDPDGTYQMQTVQLEPGDHLVLFKPTEIRPGAESTSVMDSQMLGTVLEAELGRADNLLEAVCGAIEDLAPAGDHAVLILHRQTGDQAENAEQLD